MFLPDYYRLNWLTFHLFVFTASGSEYTPPSKRNLIVEDEEECSSEEKPRKRVKWSESENAHIKEFFKDCIVHNRVLTNKNMLKFIKLYNCRNLRNMSQVKQLHLLRSKIYNMKRLAASSCKKVMKRLTFTFWSS